MGAVPTVQENASCCAPQRRGAAILKVYKGAYSNVRMAKFGIALDFGSRGRGFESRFNFTAPCFMNDRICLSVAAQYTDGMSESDLLPHRIPQPPQRLWNCSHALSNEKYRRQSDEYQYQSPDNRYLLYFGSNYRTDARFGRTPRGFFMSSGKSVQLHKGTNGHTYASECRCASHAEVAANTVPCKARTANMRSLSTGGSCSIVSAADCWF